MNPNRILELCIKYELPVEAIVFLAILQTRNWSTLYRYISTCGTFDVANIDTLLDRGWIKYTGNTPNAPKSDEFELVKSKIPKELITSNYEIMARQFWDKYPSFHVGDGKRIPLKTGVTFNEFKKIYSQSVTVEMHKEVVKAMLVLKKKNALNFGPHKFIMGEYWNAIEELTQSTTYAGPKSH
jgi:hypothetical protein